VDIDSAQQGLKPTRTLVKSYAIQNNLELDTAAAKIMLKPYDQVFVRKNPTFQLQQNVQIMGVVKYAGSYPRLSQHERLSSYIERAGGLMENANLGGAVLYRNSAGAIGKTFVDTSSNSLHQPVSIDLYQAMKNKDSKYDIILQDRDVIYIPEINPFVTVQGKVQSPIKITYDSEHSSVAYYIDKAGGFGIRPWRKRVFVTYANGKSRRTKNFFFAHFYPAVEEGCTITVPERPEGKEVSNAITQGITTVIPILLTYFILKL
jgi:protein involved in polysaccharide export with SLBB domain